MLLIKKAANMIIVGTILTRWSELRSDLPRDGFFSQWIAKFLFNLITIGSDLMVQFLFGTLSDCLSGIYENELEKNLILYFAIQILVGH